jgi:GH15 family glucan-1,4-alpha-glucosidase
MATANRNNKNRGNHHPRIEDYALIGDMQTAALVSRDGSVEWLCLPRFDSDAMFAAMLGDERNGHWRLSPVAAGNGGTDGNDGNGRTVQPPERSYQWHTLVLTTRWQTDTGVVDVIDFMPPRGNDTPVLIRLVVGVEGTVEMETTLRLRFGYGRIIPWVRRIEDCIHATAGPDSVWIDTPVQLTGAHMAHHAVFTVQAGERVPFMMTWRPSHLSNPPIPIDPDEALSQTSEFWLDWVARCTYRGPHKEAVIRSLITVKALTHQPTGGIVAAPTTSLPEDIGGVRNWDYRYCWLRDATICLEALLRTGYHEEAAAWRDWLGRAVAGSAADVQIMYGVAGERRLTEWIADWLPGYEDSAPVRIGNNAVAQRQLDVYGEIIDAFTLGKQAGLSLNRHAVSLMDRMLEFLEDQWAEPDEGIWEVRGPRRHFVHSKVMAWVAFDRRLKLADEGLRPRGGEKTLARWRAVRDAIHAQVTERGFDQKRECFTQYYGSTELDAAVLLIADLGFLPCTDPRVVSTIRTIQRDLTADGLIMRYSRPKAGDEARGQASPSVDGLPGGEGAFLACSFWLVDALALIGAEDEANALFEHLLGLRNDLGLLAEEYDPRYGRQVGNFPQAFSHVPLIRAALNLADHAPESRRQADCDVPIQSP